MARLGLNRALGQSPRLSCSCAHLYFTTSPQYIPSFSLHFKHFSGRSPPKERGAGSWLLLQSREQDRRWLGPSGQVQRLQTCVRMTASYLPSRNVLCCSREANPRRTFGGPFRIASSSWPTAFRKQELAKAINIFTYSCSTTIVRKKPISGCSTRLEARPSTLSLLLLARFASTLVQLVRTQL